MAPALSSDQGATWRELSARSPSIEFNGVAEILTGGRDVCYVRGDLTTLRGQLVVFTIPPPKHRAVK